MQSTKYQYTFDKGLNLIQKSSNQDKISKRIIACQNTNRAINHQLYHSLDLNPSEKANLNTALLNRDIFDPHGNQKRSPTLQALRWDYRSMLHTTTMTDPVSGEQTNEYSCYYKSGIRNRKITSRANIKGQVFEIQEVEYLNQLEYRTIWVGHDLSYDGETVVDQASGQPMPPLQKYVALRIRQGHKQVARKIHYVYKEGAAVNQQESTNTLANNIDSCELTLNQTGQLNAYESYHPYSEPAVRYGKYKKQPYKYSGQEEDNCGLYYYGYRSLDPNTYRWTSPDPAGREGSDLNWYAMLQGNPINKFDRWGLMGKNNKLEREWMLTVLGFIRLGTKANIPMGEKLLTYQYYRPLWFDHMIQEASKCIIYKISDKQLETNTRLKGVDRIILNEPSNVQLGFRSFQELVKAGVKNQKNYFILYKRGNKYKKIKDNNEMVLAVNHKERHLFHVLYKSRRFSSNNVHSRIALSIDNNDLTIAVETILSKNYSWLASMKSMTAFANLVQRDSVVIYIGQKHSALIMTYMTELDELLSKKIRFREFGPILMRRFSKGIYHVEPGNGKSYADNVFKNFMKPLLTHLKSGQTDEDKNVLVEKSLKQLKVKGGAKTFADVLGLPRPESHHKQ